MYDRLKSLLAELGYDDPSQLSETEIPSYHLSRLQIRDRLIAIGKIAYEDEANSIFVVSVPSGIGNLNMAIVAMHITSKSINAVAYSKDGIISQDTNSKAFRKIQDSISPIKSSNTTKNFLSPKTLIPLAIIAIMIVVILLFLARINSITEATVAYNQAVSEFNHYVNEYNTATTLTCIDNISGMPAKIETLSCESTDFADSLQVLMGANSKDKIHADTQTIRSMTVELKQAISTVQQITSPTAEWIIERISSVSGIVDCAMVTEDNNPDSLLNKEGGYTACIYFSIDTINPDEVPGKTIIDKGTDAGGSIEVYPTLADAEARCNYLSGFDNTILYSGSYAIVGTMVIRTSYKLTDSDQFKLTSAITSTLTAP